MFVIKQKLVVVQSNNVNTLTLRLNGFDQRKFDNP